MTPEQIGAWAGLIVTLMIFSYVLGDNFLYRLAVYLFAGLTAGFVTIVTIQSAIIPWINSTILSPNSGLGERFFGVIPIILSALLLVKISPRFGRLGNLALAFMIGVGTAVAVVGAISGTLIPITTTTADNIATDTANSVVMLLGVICTLVYFQYLARRIPGQLASTGKRGLFIQAISTLGKGFIVVTLGALYGGAILTSVTILSERIAFITSYIGGG